MFMDIDFDNINHFNYIMKLAKRNNYYQLQLFSSIKDYYKTNGSLRVDYVDFKGLFYIENKKVLGFIIYQFVEKVYIKVDFMLIDKEFQNKGYGKQLINKVISIKPTFIVIECEENTKDYYIKNFNFFELRKDNLKNPKDISEEEDLCHLHFIKQNLTNYNNFCYVYKV
jgi:GNAT superfamily N-acetyltransferase